MKTFTCMCKYRRPGIVPLLATLIMVMVCPTVSADGVSPDPTVIRGIGHGEVTHSDLRLGDIARVLGGTSDQRTALQSLIIGRAPAPGKDRCISDSSLKLKIRSAGHDVSRISLNLPETMCVSRKSVIFSAEMIRHRVVQFIENAAPWPREDLKISRVQVPDSVELPAGPVTCRVMPPSRERYLGLVRLPVVFHSMGRDIKKVWASAHLQISAAVVVTRRPIPRNRRIRREDLATVKKDLANLPDDVVLEMADILGRAATQPLEAYTVVRARFIEEPLIVQRGDVVRIIAQAPGLKVSTMGEAKMKGRRGDRIRVMNIDTRQSVYARVLDAQTVSVDF